MGDNVSVDRESWERCRDGAKARIERDELIEVHAERVLEGRQPLWPADQIDVSEEAVIVHIECAIADGTYDWNDDLDVLLMTRVHPLDARRGGQGVSHDAE